MSGATVVLVPQGTGPVVSLNRATSTSRTSGADLPRATVANEPDGHVYVDGANGTTIIVDSSGEMSEPIDLNTVRVPGPPKPKPKPKPTVKPDPPRTSKPPAPVRLPPAPVRPTPAKPAKPVRPLAPRDVTASPGDRTATVRWTGPAPNGAVVDQYLVEGYHGATARPGDPAATTSRVPGGSRSVRVQGLGNGEPYFFVVTAVNDAGASAGARSPVVTPSADVPGAPGDVAGSGVPGTAADPGSAKIVASWSAADGQGRSRDRT